jgi:signal transduction histidine kinase
MSGSFLLDWAVLAVSLFNTVLLLWLGLTVLLNADRRRWGIWLASGGLLLGAAFFVSHSAMLGYGLYNPGPGIDFWWHIGWIPVVVLPFAWYVVMLWYSGYWERGADDLRRRQRPGFFFTGLLAIGLAGLFVVANPLPTYWQVAQLDLAASPSLGGVPVLILAYPVYIVLCIGLSLDVLRRPGPTLRVMGDLARRRARPWLAAASVALLVVSLLVAVILVVIVTNTRSAPLLQIYAGTRAYLLAWCDLVLSLLIALSVLMLGQAIVAYEVFTGKTLPRRGLIRHWQRAILLAAGYGGVVGFGLAYAVRPIYNLLATAILMTLFYALLSWRSYAERERTIDHLRPFVASPRLYEHLLTAAPAATPDLDVAALFRALCRDLLGARLAYLVPLGPLAPLVGAALAYPERKWAPPATLVEQIGPFRSPDSACLPLDPEQFGGAAWAVPLWSERGLVGVLLLGDKRDGGLYTEEEIEIARASGERLVDTLAAAEMARRLLALQRQRLAESRDYGELSRAVFDQRARRLLHDEVLPLLHTAMLTLRGSPGNPDEALDLLADAHRQVSNLLREMPVTTSPEIEQRGLVSALRHLVETELAGRFDEVTWQVSPEAEDKSRSLSPLAAEVLFYAAREALRNAARHARDGARPLHVRLSLAWQPGELELQIEDDGVGLDAAQLAANGRGLALHSTMMAVVGGTLAVESLPGAHTRVSLALPAP